ncbi:MBG domain-containing protein [Dactylosporangium salmoneum]|uniref:Ig-like domain-containing protein n=1 Tax=Dactylosporangium salmoneum TaxID=53361 RepID=A0ABP5SRE3_9ACTN
MTYRRRAYRLLALLALAIQGAFLLVDAAPAEAAGPNAVITDAGCRTTSLGRSDDGTSGEVPLGFSVNFFGTTYGGMFVSNNGDVTFGEAYSGYSGLDLSAFGSPIVAVAFYDVDTRSAGTTPVSYGPVTYAGRPAYCVNWVNVGYYNNGEDRLNSSQLLLVDRSDTGANNFDIVMNYDRLVYEPSGGLTVGYSSGTEASTYVYPGSGVAGALVDTNTSTGLVHNSGGSSQRGRYVYQVRGGRPSPPGGQSIDFAAIADVTYGVAPFTVGPAASSGLPVSLAASGACTVSGSTVAVTAVGTCTLTASQAGDGTYTAAAPVTRAFQVTKAPVPVSLAGLGQTYDGTQRAVTAVADPDPGNGAMTVTYDGSATAPTVAGSYAVQATYSSATHAGSASGTLVVARAAQTITFPELPGRSFGDNPVRLGASSGAGLPVTYAAAGTCAVAGATLTITGAGQCTVTAAQGGDANHTAAAPVSRSFAVAKGAVTITLTGLSQVYSGTAREVKAAVDPAGVGTVRITYDGSLTPPTTAGTYHVVVSVDGPNREGLLEATLTVAKAPQAVDFADLAAATFGDAPRPLAATASSGLPVRFTATGSCELRDGALAFARGGECVVTAHQDGDANRLAAPGVARTIDVARAVQELRLSAPGALTVGGAAGAVAAESSAGLPVQVSAAGGCELRTEAGAGTLAPVHAGDCTVTAAQPGDESYLPAATATATARVARGAATLHVRDLSQAADGRQHTAAVTTTPSGLTGVAVTYNASGTAPRKPGTYRVVAALDNPDWVAAPVVARLTLAQPAPAPVQNPITGTRPELAPNAALSMVGGKASTITRAPDQGGGLKLTGSGFTAAVAALSASRVRQPLDADGKLVVDRKHEVLVSMTGFAANTRADVWLFSDPVLIGRVTAGADGSVDATLPVPASLPVGEHTLQVNGLTADGQQRSLAVGLVLVDVPATPTPAASGPATTAPAEPSDVQAVPSGPVRTTAPAPPASSDPLDRLPKYVPAAHAAAVLNTGVAGFTLLAVSAGAGAGAATHKTSRRKGGKISSGSSKFFKERWDGTGPGDRSFTWRLLPSGWLDRLSLALPQRVAPYSPLIARILGDGSYLRSMFGVGWWAVPAAGAVLGAVAAVQSHGSPLPSAGIMLALVVLGILDAFAGLAAAVVFFASVVASGGVTSADGLRLLLGVCAMWFAFALLAGVVRPFRRPPAERALDWWTRGADVLIASLMGGWAVQKAVGALSGLAGHHLPIASSADRIALAALATIAGRIVLETVAAWAYPQRLCEVRPEKLPKPGTVQRLTAIGLRTAVFVFVSVSFLGAPWQLWVGTVLFIVPQVLSVYEDKFPNQPKLFRVLPKRIVKTVFMMLVGTVASLVLAKLIHDPESRIVNGFILLTLPGLAFSLIELFGREGETKDQSWPRELAGGAVVAVGIAAALGVFS